METPAIPQLRLADDDKPEPLDLSHHFSVVTQRRVPSQLKQAYKFFQIPGILNIAGGSYSHAISYLNRPPPFGRLTHTPGP
jgi:hypothetical protein